MKTIIGVMGPGETAMERDRKLARELGRRIAEKGWVLLTGGRTTGVMDAALEGAKEAGGLTIGVLPTATLDGMSPSVDIPIVTGLGEARNVVNILTSQVVLVCGMSAGTASEVALAMNRRRPVVLVSPNAVAMAFFSSFNQPIHKALDPEDAVRIAEQLLRVDAVNPCK